jgi:magnesium-transporting ATPase (P-type)
MKTHEINFRSAWKCRTFPASQNSKNFQDARNEKFLSTFRKSFIKIRGKKAAIELTVETIIKSLLWAVLAVLVITVIVRILKSFGIL